MVLDPDGIVFERPGRFEIIVIVVVLETGLMGILTELLEVDTIDRNDDFFMLGGHSFIAAQLIARIRDRFHVQLGLRAVFEHPTLAEIAEQIEQKMTVGVN